MNAIDSVCYGVMDSLNYYKISTYYTADSGFWYTLLSAFLGGLMTFVFTLIAEYIRSRNLEKKEMLAVADDIRSMILEADKYVGEFLDVQMQIAGSQDYINHFGQIVSKIEFFLEKKKLLMKKVLYENMDEIKNKMFTYRNLAMRCTIQKELADATQGDLMADHIKAVNDSVEKCKQAKIQWRKRLLLLEQEMENEYK